MMAAPTMRAGQTVYLACGARVEPVTYLRNMNGRCLVACGNGGITVSRNRLFLTEDEAKSHLPSASVKRIREMREEELKRQEEESFREESDLRWQLDVPMEPEYAPETHCQSWRYSPMEAPGDGWAGR